ncbi:ulp1 protease family, C-terminal catalytic domain-containing protein [Tanacetum coccineum]|uniref:Ulp1 protease family, C-terminal catalytic domain-containing protein n=1 Tax=Tanacetum coccineum TaxID=301880 RepID=A0ABQ5FY61_9ASTR
MRTASAAAKPCQGDSLEFYLITGSIYTDQRGTVVITTVFDEKALSENEKKVAEFIWRACNDGSKDLQVQLGIFKSLFPNVEVAAGILDIWSLVLNHEEKYRENNSGGGNIYIIVNLEYNYDASEHLIESGADLIRRRSIFESNITAVLSQSPYESFHDVDLVFFPMVTTKRSHHFYLICFNMKTAEINIIDNLDNDVDDIIHVLLMDTGIAIHMLIEKTYPLTEKMLSRMLSRRLEVDHECKMAYKLLRGGLLGIRGFYNLMLLVQVYAATEDKRKTV